MSDNATVRTTARLEVGPSLIHGRGVFAVDGANTGDVVERCPVIVIPADERDAVEDSVLGHYCYEWVDGDGALALGFGSLYNHSGDPNAEFDFDEAEGAVVIIARRDIDPGEEVTIRYWPEGETDHSWFELADAAPHF